MGYRKPSVTTRAYLELQPLPNHGNTYTVIPHARVIEQTLRMLNDSGFRVTNETYRCNMNAQVAQGIYHIVPLINKDRKVMEERELGMMFAWTNSYDKSTRFQCSIGAHVLTTGINMCTGELSFARKHTGSADAEIQAQISSQIKNAEITFRGIIDDRDFLNNTMIAQLEQARLLGTLYCDVDILDNTQMSMIKDNIKTGGAVSSAWTFYNYVATALKITHPRTWLKDMRAFHNFITSNVKSTTTQQTDVIKETTIYNPYNKAQDLELDTSDWLEEPNTVELDMVQNRVENLLRVQPQR